MSEIERFRRLCTNTLDVVTERYLGLEVEFFATENDALPIVVLRIRGKEATVSTSSCLTTRDWAAAADAYARAVSFIRRAKLSDGGVEEVE